eukprot:scaffold23186_cov112-Isochrysis_galbana.AAC.10
MEVRGPSVGGVGWAAARMSTGAGVVHGLLTVSTHPLETARRVRVVGTVAKQDATASAASRREPDPAPRAGEGRGLVAVAPGAMEARHGEGPAPAALLAPGAAADAFETPRGSHAVSARRWALRHSSCSAEKVETELPMKRCALPMIS